MCDCMNAWCASCMGTNAPKPVLNATGPFHSDPPAGFKPLVELQKIGRILAPGPAMESAEYPFKVRPLSPEEGGGYLIEFPDLPGCMSDGETVEEAIRNGEEAKCDWIGALEEAGRPIPRPSTGSVTVRI